MLLRCVAGVEVVGGGMLGFVRGGRLCRNSEYVATPMFSYSARSRSRVCFSSLRLPAYPRPSVPCPSSFQDRTYMLVFINSNFNWLPQSLVSFLDASRPSPFALHQFQCPTCSQPF